MGRAVAAVTDASTNWLFMLLGTVLGFLLSAIWQTRRDRYDAIFKKLDRIESKLDELTRGKA